MKPYQHFKLERPPFEAAPDPRVFFSAPAHAEALATLEYTLFARKPCAVVIGDSGLGKTLLARFTAATASAATSVLWVQGIGQTDDATEVHVFRRGALLSRAGEASAEQTTLAAWSRTPPKRANAPLLIIDNADDLPERGWNDVLALLSRDIPAPEPVKLAMFGTPELLKILSRPALTRLRRRVFRTCILRPLTLRQVTSYVEARLKEAGGRFDDVFAADTMDHVYRLSCGNPALVNQVCDNALLEAFGRGHARVRAADIMAAARALTGVDERIAEAGAIERLRARGVRALLERQTDEPALLAPPVICDEPAPRFSPAHGVPSATAAAETETTCPPDATLEQRLFSLEARLSNAMATVRRVRFQREEIVGEAREVAEHSASESQPSASAAETLSPACAG